jgi:hypothetical protein
LLDIREKLLAEKGAWDAVLKDAEELFGRFKSIPRLESDDAKTLAYVKLHRRLLETADTLSDIRQHLRDLNSLIDGAAKEADNNPSVVNYITQARTQVSTLTQDTAALHTRLGTLDKTVKKTVHQVPPPPTFTTSTGLTMTLVNVGQTTFYVSNGPIRSAQFRTFLDAVNSRPGQDEVPAVPAAADAGDTPATDLQWYAARNFCRWLSETEKRVYRLPELADLRILSSQSNVPSVAVWSATQWRHRNVQERNMAERFGIAMVGVWDPTGKLADERVFPELPFAQYSDIGFLVVTSEETGRADRWDRLKPQLDN